MQLNMFVLFTLLLDECRTLTKNSRTISQHFPTPHNILCISERISKSILHNLVKRTLHNLVENPEALGFHQEQTSRTNGNNRRFNRNPRIGFVSNLILFTQHILFEIFQSQKKKREKKFLLQVSVIIQKIQNPKSLF